MAKKEPNIKITVGKDEPIEKALKRFKRLCEKAGIRKEVRARRYYEKPSEIRRRAIRKAERNKRKTKRFKEQKDNKKVKPRSWLFTHPKLDEQRTDNQ